MSKSKVYYVVLLITLLVEEHYAGVIQVERYSRALVFLCLAPQFPLLASALYALKHEYRLLPCVLQSLFVSLVAVAAELYPHQIDYFCILKRTANPCPAASFCHIDSAWRMLVLAEIYHRFRLPLVGYAEIQPAQLPL